MNAIDLITQYQQNNAGMSNYLDHRLKQTQTAIQDAMLRKAEGELDWYTSNLYIARTLTENTLKAIPHKSAIRDSIVAIYKAISEELNP